MAFEWFLWIKYANEIRSLEPHWLNFHTLALGSPSVENYIYIWKFLEICRRIKFPAGQRNREWLRKKEKRKKREGWRREKEERIVERMVTLGQRCWHDTTRHEEEATEMIEARNQSNESMIGQWPAGRIIEHRAVPLGFGYCLSVSGEATRATRINQNN